MSRRENKFKLISYLMGIFHVIISMAAGLIMGSIILMVALLIISVMTTITVIYLRGIRKPKPDVEDLLKLKETFDKNPRHRRMREDME